MKKLFILCASLIFSLYAHARVITVSNNGNSPGQYTDINAAITAAANNDTLYIHGSPTSYGAITLDKPLTFIGAGGLPNKNFRFPTTFASIVLAYNANFTRSASGSRLYGLECSTIILSGENITFNARAISNITIERCKVSGSIQATSGTQNTALCHQGINIRNCTVVYCNLYSSRTSIFANNIVTGSVSGGEERVGTWLISNNLFFPGPQFGYNTSLGACRAAVITNNIFYNGARATSSSFTSANGLNFCTVSNNLVYSVLFNYVSTDIVFGTNSGGNNIINQDPLFTYWDPTTQDFYLYSERYPTAGPFANFRLMTSSPGRGAGSDGLDIGLYGGGTPFVEGFPADSRYRYFPMPAIPQMLDVNILNATIQQSGTLNVQFKANK